MTQKCTQLGWVKAVLLWGSLPALEDFNRNLENQAQDLSTGSRVRCFLSAPSDPGRKWSLSEVFFLRMVSEFLVSCQHIIAAKIPSTCVASNSPNWKASQVWPRLGGPRHWQGNTEAHSQELCKRITVIQKGRDLRALRMCSIENKIKIAQNG